MKNRASALSYLKKYRENRLAGDTSSKAWDLVVDWLLAPENEDKEFTKEWLGRKLGVTKPTIDSAIKLSNQFLGLVMERTKRDKEHVYKLVDCKFIDESLGSIHAREDDLWSLANTGKRAKNRTYCRTHSDKKNEIEFDVSLLEKKVNCNGIRY